MGITMEAGDFSALRKESRLGGDSDVQIFENVVGWIVSGCSAKARSLFRYYEADVEVGGTTVARVGVRKKGFLGSVISNGLRKPSIKVKTDKFVEGQLISDLERITLNNNNQDLSRMRTCLAYELFRDAGYPAPRCQLANVMLNGESLGAYSRVEPLKKRFLRRAFGNDDGSLYEGTIADFSLGHLAGASEGELGHWEAKTGDSGPLLAVTNALSASDEELASALGEVVNLDTFIRFWALETLVAHQDSYTGGSNNFYIYFDPADEGRGTFVPWGADDVFNGDEERSEIAGEALRDNIQGELARRLSRIPETRALYRAELERLLAEVWNEEVLLERIDAYASLVRTAQAAPEYDEEIAELKDWVEGRRDYMESALSQELARGDESSTACEEGIPGGMLDLATKFGFAF